MIAHNQNGVNILDFQKKRCYDAHQLRQMAPLATTATKITLEGSNSMLYSFRLLGVALTLLLGLLFSVTVSYSDPQTPYSPNCGVLNVSLHNDTSPPLASMTPIPPGPSEASKSHTILRPQGEVPRKGSNLQPYVIPLPMPTPLRSFSGIANVPNGDTPPDPNGAVGPNHFVQMVNSAIEIWDKAGNHLYGPYSSSTLWQGFNSDNTCLSNYEDPIVLYDALADRWLVSYLIKSTNSYECVAVSTSPNPLGSYYRYLIHPADDMDYPKFGIWPDAYYMSIIHNAGLGGASAIALKRADMLAGNPMHFQSCEVTGPVNTITLLPSDLDGYNVPPVGAPNIFATINDTHTNNNQISLYKFHVDWNNPTLTTFIGSSLTTAYFSSLCTALGGYCIPQPAVSGTPSPPLDSVSDRLMYRLVYRNMGDHETLLANHTVDPGAIRWYEIRDPNGIPSIYQYGTYAPPGSDYRWMGSLAMDRNGNVALGYSVSGSTTFPSIRYTGRDVNDPLNDLRQETSLIAGGGAQVDSPPNRWGDYSRMAVDPIDDCTFWYTSEYYQTTSATGWKTQIGTFKFPSCQPAGCQIRFTDVPPGSTFYTYVHCLFCQSVIAGYTDSSYCPTGVPCFLPGNALTRGQLAKIVANAAAFVDPVPSTQQTFEDVIPGSTFWIYVERLANRSIIGGYSCGSSPAEPCNPPNNRPYYRPDNPVSRGQLAKVVSNAVGYTETPTGQTFEDVLPGSTFYAFVERLATRGIANGYPCGGPQEPCLPPANRPYYRPTDLTTRGQTSKIVSNTFFPNCGSPNYSVLPPESKVPNQYPSATVLPGSTATPLRTVTNVVLTATPILPTPVPTEPLPLPLSTAPVPTAIP